MIIIKIYDLHTHTNYSDGLYSPKEVIDKAIEKGLDGISITDHDTTDGIPEALEYVKNLENFKIIPGIEFSCCSSSTDEVHILGYFIDTNKEKLIKVISKIKSSRWARGIAIMDKLDDLGIVLPRENILEDAKSNGFIGRANIARELVKYNHVKSIREAFEKYLDNGKPAYFERYMLSIKNTINLIHEADGISVVAHPGLMEDQNVLMECINYGIMGLECYHPKHTEVQVINYLNFCKKHNLIVTGGSDYHGDEDVLGDYTTDINLIQIFKEKI